MKLRPVGDRFLIEPAKAPETSSGGIYMPAADQGGTREGVIVAGGNPSLETGARVLYDRKAVTRVGDTGLVLVDWKDILAVYEGG